LLYEFSRRNNPRTIINATADICGFLNGTNSDALTKWIVSIIEAAVPPGFLHSCPYFGMINLANIFISFGVDDVFPDGFYATKVRFFNARDENIFTLQLLVETRKSGNGDIRF